jgi:hypothetical protein
VVFDTSLDLPLDFWIIRSPITFSTGGSPAVARLNLFVYVGLSGFSMTPPVVAYPDQFNFQYTLAFSDGSWVGNPLQTLHKVPESGSNGIWFLASSFVGAAMFLSGSRFRHRSSRR